MNALARLAGIDEIGSAVAGAVAGTAVDELFGFGMRLHTSRLRRVARFADSTATYAPGPLDSLLTDAAVHPEKLELLVQAVENAARSHDDWKIDLLARLFVAGVTDKTPVDQVRVLVETVRQLEVPHLRVLIVLAKPGPHRTEEAPNVGSWSIEARDVWRTNDIKAADRGIAAALDVLVARLQSLGLVRDEQVATVDFEPIWALTAFGRQLVDYLTERAHGTGEAAVVGQL